MTARSEQLPQLITHANVATPNHRINLPECLNTETSRVADWPTASRHSENDGRTGFRPGMPLRELAGLGTQFLGSEWPPPAGRGRDIWPAT